MLDDIPTSELYTLVIRNIPLLLNIKGFKGLFSYYGEVQDCYLGIVLSKIMHPRTLLLKLPGDDHEVL